MNKNNKILIAQHFIICIISAVVLLRQFRLAINPDTAWLTSCAHRYYEGIPLINGCYDTNPPLSTLIYVPSIALSDLTAIKIYYSVYITIFALIILSTVLTYLIIKKRSFLSKEEHQIVVVAYITAVVISPQYDFSQRDHLIVVTAIPFFLTQISITKKIPINSLLSHLSLAFGTLMIMVKPHYGLFPSLLIIHRLITQKRIGVIFDRDFIYLSSGSLVYAATLFIFFPDFIITILPDILNYYIPYNNEDGVKSLLTPYILPVLLLSAAAFTATHKNRERQYFYASCWLGTLCALLAFHIQAKGFYYQIIPAKTFFLISCSLTVFSFARYLLKDKDKHLLLTPLASLLIIAIPLYKSYKYSSQFPTHDYFLKAPLTQFIKAECGSPCSYYMTYPHMSLNTQTSFYIGDAFASRFPAFWFFPAMEAHLGVSEEIIETKQYKERIEADKGRFSDYVVEDLKKYRPRLLLVYKEKPDHKGTVFNYFEYFSTNSDFKKIMEKYKRNGEFSIDRQGYLKGTSFDSPLIQQWDVYILKETNNNPP